MSTHHQPDFADQERPTPNPHQGSGPCAPSGFFPPKADGRRPVVREESAGRPTEELPLQARESESPRADRDQPTTRSRFGLDEIQSIDFRCDLCQTVVRFPRIQWAGLPESCPNCGTEWMREPASQGLWPEDQSAYVFRTMRAFREALQALVGLGGSSVFTLQLEMNEQPNHGKLDRSNAERNNGSPRT